MGKRRMYEWNEHQAGRGDFPLTLPKELIAKTEEVQADFTEDDPRIGQIQDYLDKLRADGITRVCSKQVAVEALGLGDDDCRNNKALFGDISTIIDYRCPGWKRHGMMWSACILSNSNPFSQMAHLWCWRSYAARASRLSNCRTLSLRSSPVSRYS